jgi:hypothetical protein
MWEKHGCWELQPVGKRCFSEKAVTVSWAFNSVFIWYTFCLSQVCTFVTCSLLCCFMLPWLSSSYWLCQKFWTFFCPSVWLSAPASITKLHRQSDLNYRHLFFKFLVATSPIQEPAQLGSDEGIVPGLYMVTGHYFCGRRGEASTWYVSQADLQLMILLSQPSMGWHYRCEPLCQVIVTFLPHSPMVSGRKTEQAVSCFLL